jgi:hypothetical protein
MKHAKTKYEYMKFDKDRPAYEAGMKEILAMPYEKKDFINHFPAFVGHLTLARFLAMYEAYKMVVDVAGHIAEVGVDKGTSSLYFAKLLKIFEPNSTTLVHGFDWFQGNKPTKEEAAFIEEGSYKTDEEQLRQLIKAQGLENALHIHNLDATKELKPFFEENNHLQFKLVFLDIGIYDVVAESIRNFWPRMTPGGILLLDHYSFEMAPGEIRAVRDLLPNVKFRQFPFGWMPVAYAIKE